MIKRYKYGNMIETEAILAKPELSSDEVSFLTVNEETKTLFYKMTKL